MKILSRLFLLLLLVLPATILISSDGNQRLVVGAQDDDAGDDDEEATVASDEEPTAAPTEEEEFEEEVKIEPHPMADTTLLFTKFGGKGEIPAGKFIELLIGLSNNHEEEFLVDTVDASFRYPMDYNYYIQNFSTISYNVVIEPGSQASFYYGFITNEYFSGRPFGLTVNLNYRGKDGKEYRDAVFNDTVQVVEVEEGIDGETFFLYLFFVAVVVLLAVAAQQFLANMGKRRSTKSKVEIGTQNHSDVDYDWIPQETIAADSKRSPGKSPGKKSPRQRRTTKRAKGAGDD